MVEILEYLFDITPVINVEQDVSRKRKGMVQVPGLLSYT